MTVTCDTCHVAAVVLTLAALTIGGAYLLLTHGPQHLTGADWGEDEPEWEMK